VDYPYRPPRVDDNLYQAELPDLLAPFDGGHAAEGAGTAAADEKKKGRKPTKSECEKHELQARGKYRGDAPRGGGLLSPVLSLICGV